ncbi:MAG: malectin domain-containing carbohydrate-binding protein, partial [Phycisphaerae bacterium]
DKLVKGSLGILWYGEPGPGRMANRHASAASPLAVGGRMFVQGEDVVMAYDAYNGLLLWQRDIKGATRLNLKRVASNLAADADGLFVAVEDRCLRLDPATGKTLITYKAPAGKDGKTGRWQYVACVGGTLYGSRDNRCVFAVDVGSGKLRWAHEGKDIEARTICVGDGRVYFIERSVTKAQQDEATKGIPADERLDRRGKPIKPDVRLVVALDAQTGREDWARPQYVADCVGISKGGGELTVMYANNVLLLCGQPWNGHFWRELMAGEFSRRSLIALSGYDGRPLWSGRKGYRSRPLIIGNRIIAEPWAHDLQSGAEEGRVHAITGAESKWQMSRPGHHCGNIVAAPNALFFRSGTTAYYDLTGDYGTAHFGGQRPGCWINCIPAAGLVLMPEASSGCICPFALQCTIVFQPRKANRVWGMYSAAGAALPVKRLAVNFGAPGDRKDSAGTLWLAYPRPMSREKDYDQRLVLDFKIAMKAASRDAGYLRGNADFLEIGGSDDPWIYAFGCTGFERCTIPLVEKDGKGGRYKVRLHFSAPADDKPGGRVFDVAVQGKTVLKDFDIVAAAGGPNRAVVKEIKGVRVTDALAISMKAAKGEALLCGVEVLREGK